MGPCAAILLACAAAAVTAHDSSESLHQHLVQDVPGYCQLPLLRSFPLLSNQFCGSGPIAPVAPVAPVSPVAPVAPAATKHAAALTNPVWTHASSCISEYEDPDDDGSDEFCVFSSTSFASGRGITVVTSPRRADFIAALPSFTRSEVLMYENVEADPAPYKMLHVPGKGMGVVATRPIMRGDHLMSFTPAIMLDYGAFDAVDVTDIRRMQTQAVSELPTTLRGLLLNLSTHDVVTDYEEKVDRILRTNAFDVEVTDELESGLFVVFPEISRFNHDCRPNADYWFDPETLVQHVYATRPIAAGQEIALTYMDPLTTRAGRQAKLQDVWGFKCTCSLCSQRPELTMASDRRLRQIKNIRKQLEDYSPESVATPDLAELFVSLYEQERLDGSIYEAYSFAAIEWNGAGHAWKAVRYAQLAIEHGLAAVGPRDTDVVEMKLLAEDPWTHWSHMLRTSKRMRWSRMKEELSGLQVYGQEDNPSNF